MADSKKIDDGGSAFPIEGGVDSGLHADPGMRLREYYAGQAMIGLIQGYAVAYGSPTNAIDEVANEAVSYADALIAALRDRS